MQSPQTLNAHAEYCGFAVIFQQQGLRRAKSGRPRPSEKVPFAADLAPKRRRPGIVGPRDLLKSLVLRHRDRMRPPIRADHARS